MRWLTHGAGPVAAHVVAITLLTGMPALAQIDHARAEAYFKEAAALCAKDNGTLWGISLCGPIVISDPVSRTIATSQPAPDAPRPPALGFANAAMAWGGTRWSTIVWQYIPAAAQPRGRLWIHELFHRVQPRLGLFLDERPNNHLDTLEGRYWLQLEWRALAAAIRAAGEARVAAIADALAFRHERRRREPAAAESERIQEINEGLAQYSGTVIAAGNAEAARAEALVQLEEAEKSQTFVRTFAYPSGAAYGVLLDVFAPGWPRRFTAADDIGALLATAARATATVDAAAAAARYSGSDLRAAEQERDRQQQARVAELRKRFVEGPVLILPFASGASFTTAGVTPIPGAGIVQPNYRLTGPWGTLEASQAFVSADRTTISVPAPARVDTSPITGDGWTLTLAAGWTIAPGARAGDFSVVKK